MSARVGRSKKSYEPRTIACPAAVRENLITKVYHPYRLAL